VIRALLVSLVLAAPASAQVSVDGFTGYEKQVTGKPYQGEPSVTVGPHGKPLLVSFMGCGIAVSHDRGATFSATPTPADPGPTPGAPAHNCSDPQSAIGPRGDLYTGVGWWDTPAGAVDYYNMYVARSTDDGRSWGKPVYATGDQDLAQNLLLGRNTGHSDRLFLATDASTDTLYASATDFPRFVRWVRASHDHGLSFGPLHAIDSDAYPQIQGEQAGDYVPAAANGQLAFAYTASVAGTRGCPCGIFETSRDDGATWIRHPAPFPANWVAADPRHPGHFAIMSGQGVTATPAHPGAIAVATTPDSGATWTKTVLVGDDGHPKIEPWMAYSPQGVLGVGYKVLDSGVIDQPLYFAQALAGQLSYTYEYWSAVSFDGGQRFSAPLKISNLPSPPGSGQGDDFAGIALDDRYLYAVWGDQRKAPLDPTPVPVTTYLGRVPLSAYDR
jgi:hypothetical protein